MFIKNLILSLSFFIFTPVFLVITMVYFSVFYTNSTETSGEMAKYGYSNEVIAAEQITPAFILGAYTLSDAIPVIISRYLEHYGSKIPADLIVKYAKENNVDPRLIVAIAQQESNLGKKMPESCHNAWGYGIHSRGTLCFENWEEGIKTVIEGIAEKYCQKGLCDDPCLMMKKYTPSSNGSWCYGVNQFMEKMRTGKF